MDLYDDGAYKDPNVFSVDALLRDGKGKFSTLISWEAKGLWRHGSGDYKKDSILGQLGHCGPGGHKVNNYDLISGYSPFKAQIIYIFEYNDDGSLSLKVFSYDPNRTKDVIQPINSGSDWPTNLCT